MFKNRKPYYFVCWRSASVVLAGKMRARYCEMAALVGRGGVRAGQGRHGGKDVAGAVRRLTNERGILAGAPRARTRRHGRPVLDVQCAGENFGQLPDLIATVDKVWRWTFLSLQEVARENDEPQVMKLRDGHAVYVGPAAQGTFAVAVVIHRNWVETVSEFHHADRMVWLACSARDRGGRHRWVVGSAQPPRRGETEEDFESALPSLENVVGKYTKRTMQLWGVDAKVELTADVCPPPAVGTRIPAAPHIPAQGMDREIAMAQGGMLALNTFKEWDEQARDPAAFDSSGMAS